MYDEGTGGTEVNKLFQKETPECIQKVLKEYSDVFQWICHQVCLPSDGGMILRLI